eukprot:g1748.t1
MGAGPSNNRRRTPKEIYRESKRGIKRSRRALQREKRKLERTEKKYIRQIKKEAKNNRMYAVKMLAKDLVGVRKQIRQFLIMDTQMNSMMMKLTMQNASMAMGQTLKSSTRAMATMRRLQNLPAMNRIFQQFQKEQFMSEFGAEMMADALDEMDDAEEEDAEGVVDQVMQELGLELTVDMPSAASGKIASQQNVQQTAPSDMERMEERLAALAA